jgi:hypothetical protein
MGNVPHAQENDTSEGKGGQDLVRLHANGTLGGGLERHILFRLSAHA